MAGSIQPYPPVRQPTVSSGAPVGSAGGDLSGTYPNPTLANGGLLAVATPGAYPYNIAPTDRFVIVDTSANHQVNLPDDTSYVLVKVADGTGTAAAHNITVALANAAKAFNGTVGGTVTINNSAVHEFWRDTSGNWHGQ